MDCDQGQPRRSNWRGGCVITTEGVCLDARKNGQIAGSDCRSGRLERRKHCAARLWLPREPHRLLSSRSFQSSSGECRIKIAVVSQANQPCSVYNHRTTTMKHFYIAAMAAALITAASSAQGRIVCPPGWHPPMSLNSCFDYQPLRSATGRKTDQGGAKAGRVNSKKPYRR